MGNSSSSGRNRDVLAGRILVTGGSGFLGSHLCAALSRVSTDVHAISRKPQAGAAGVRWWQGDLCDAGAAARLLREIKPEIIFHLTTHGWGAPGLEHVQPTLHSDIMATVNVLSAAAEGEVRRIILAGSCEEPSAEAPELVPASPYAAAKWVCGTYGRMFHHLYGTPVVIVRIFMVYGPRQPAQKVIPYTILSLLNQQRPKLSSAERLIDWIYIDDVIAGFLAAARAAGIEGQTVDLGSGLLVSVRDVVERLVSSINPGLRPLYGALPTRPGELIRAANIAGTAQRIGWRATTPLAEGLESTVRWYRSQLNQNACTQTAPLERPQSASDKSYDGPEPASRS